MVKESIIITYIRVQKTHQNFRVVTLVISRRMFGMVLVFIRLVTGASTKENGVTTYHQVEEFSVGQMGPNTTVNGKMDKEMVLEN